jgi:hypothetical protein
MSLAAVPDPQTSLYETTIDNPEIEALLEERAKRKATASEAGKRARTAHDRVIEELEKLDLADAPVRIGNYVVARRPVKARHVEFTAEATSRLVIKPLPEA